jgi:hypothetical protein
MEDEQNSAEVHPKQVTGALLTWRVDAGDFDNSLIMSLRANDRASIILVMDEISRDMVSLLSSETENAPKELTMMLDRLACVAAVALRFREPLLFDSCVKTTFSVYMSGFDENGNSRSPTSRERRVSSPLLWLELAKRLMAVGGLALRRNDWRAVRRLALKITEDRGSISYGESQYWLRHAVTEAANAGIFDTRKNREEDGSLITTALGLVEGELCFRPDLPSGDYRLLRSLLGFDLLSTLVISADAGGFDYRYVYPSFIYWNLHQVEPLLVRLLHDQEIRDELFPAGIENAFLARVLRAVSGAAGRSSTGWSRWSGRKVVDFLSKYPEADNA